MKFLKDLVLSEEFKKGILIGGGILGVACVISWLVN
jgi:hypothetical protein